jgi:hypothetical protein
MLHDEAADFIRKGTPAMSAPTPPTPISLSDQQLQQIMTAAASLHVADRDAFLRGVAERLRRQVIGDGTVSRAVRDAQREFFRAPLGTEVTAGRKAPHHNYGRSYKLV